MRSEFLIPELPLAAPGEAANVWVHYGTVPKTILNAATAVEALEVSPRETLLRVKGVAQFLIRGGREVIIQPEPGAIQADLRAYLAAAAFGILCHQCGMLPLHASSIELDEGVVAFLGDSGAGKSTLAAFLGNRGYPLVSDDICLLDFRSGDTPVVVPVTPWIKLWRDAVEQLGSSTGDLPRVFSDDDKYRFNIGSNSKSNAADGKPGDRRLSLRQILVLGWLDENHASTSRDTPTGPAATIDRLDKLHAIRAMLEFTHQPYLIEGMGRARECFELCGRALTGVEAFRFQRRRGFEHNGEALDALEAHFRKSGSV